MVTIKVETCRDVMNAVLDIIEKHYASRGSRSSLYLNEYEGIEYSTGIGTWGWGSFAGVTTKTLREFKEKFYALTHHESKWHCIREFTMENWSIEQSIEIRMRTALMVQSALEQAVEVVDESINNGISQSWLVMANGDRWRFTKPIGLNIDSTNVVELMMSDFCMDIYAMQPIK